MRLKRPPRIDPFTLKDPWRRFVQSALGAQRRYERAAGSVRRGPLADRLAEIGGRVAMGVQECWHVAQRGEELVDARRQVDPSSDVAKRLDGIIETARERLQQLDARLEEAVARAIELSVHAGSGAELSGVGTDVDDVVTELEALRQGLEEARRADESER